MSELLPLSRAARRLGVSARWLKSEATAGRVPCLRADSRFLFDEAAVTEALRKRAASSGHADAAPIDADSLAVREGKSPGADANRLTKNERVRVPKPAAGSPIIPTRPPR